MSSEETLALVSQLLGGSYDNRAQVAAAQDAAPDEWHRMQLNQMLVPITLEGFDGLTYFQQLTEDGTSETLRAVGIFHFYVDASGQAVMRLRSFKDRARFTDAHLDQSILQGVTMDDLRWTDGCEMYFGSDGSEERLHATMKEESCYPVNQQTGQKLWHIDELVIMPGEIWSNGRFYDLDGNFLFGNASDEHQKFVRYED